MCKSLVCHLPATKKVVISVVSFDIRYFFVPLIAAKDILSLRKKSTMKRVPTKS